MVFFSEGESDPLELTRRYIAVLTEQFLVSHSCKGYNINKHKMLSQYMDWKMSSNFFMGTFEISKG